MLYGKSILRAMLDLTAQRSSSLPSRQDMNVVVYTRIWTPDVLRLADVRCPLPKDNEALIKVHAVSRNASD
jgi:hypothetical protein